MLTKLLYSLIPASFYIGFVAYYLCGIQLQASAFMALIGAAK